MTTYPTMRSKFNSTCPFCRSRISIGDNIAKRNGKWGHEQCPDSAPLTQREIAATRALPTTVFNSNVATLINEADAFAPAETNSPAPQREFVPSNYQQAIFDYGLNGSGNLVVNATAGSGKTRTIQEFIKRYIPTDKSWIYLVFNKKNQVEAQEKFGNTSNGTVATFHSFCLNNSIRQAYGRVKIDDKKTYRELEICSSYDERELRPLAAKIVGLVKNTLTDVDSYDALVEMCDHYAVELNGSTARVFEMARDVIHQSKANTAIIDFDDMLWLTTINHLPLPQYDYVLVDETQDLNAVQIEIMLRIRKETGRTIAIGDENQAIYGFRGADVDAMDKVIAALEAKVLPLSLCYRNSKAVAHLVNDAFPQIKHECLPDAPEGEVLTIAQQDLQACVRPGDMVICRTNAPLVKPAFDLIRRGIKAVIMGRSIGEELVNLINRVTKRINTENLEVILSELGQYQSQECARLLRQGKEAQAQSLEDKVDTIFALADGCKLLSELIGKAESIFSDDAKGVVFSSAHRAKGLEADSVFILKYDLMPHPMALKSGKAWQLKQETNCKFVALTRAKLKLYFVEE